MTIAEELVRDVERMKAQGKSVEEIMVYTDEVVDRWNREEFARQQMRRMMNGALA